MSDFNLKNKKLYFSLSLILMLSVSLLMPFIQSSNAQVGVPQPVKTVGYISVAPTLVGVDQEATVNLWVFPMPTNYLYRPYYKGFEGITVTFTKPDGSKDSFMPVSGTHQFDPGQSEALGGIFFYYAPDMAGDWSVSFTMPPQNLTDSSGTVLYQGCTSMTAYFTVQEEPVLAGLLNGYPWGELPDTDVYWSYPINSNNRDWSQVSSEWLGITTVYNPGLTHWQPYGSGPNTAHVVWSQPLKAGGIIGGDYGSLSYSSGMNLGQAIIMQGKVFVNVPNTGKFECIDLTTGEILYSKDGSVTAGLHIPGNAFIQSGYDASVVLANSYGAIPTAYLFGSSGATWNYYDPFTGTLMRSISNCSSAQLVDGTPLGYGVASGKLYAWNMSKVVNNNWPTGKTWESSLPTSLTGSVPSLFGISGDLSTIVLTTRNQFWGFSAETGASLWNLTLTYPVVANEEFVLYGVDGFIVYDAVEATFKCYSMKTGVFLWESDSFSDSPWATTWTTYVSQANDYDNLYLQFPDGTMTALSLKTGKTLWRSEAFPSTEYTNNAVPFVIGMVMVGGNLYGYAGYSVSYQLDPIPRFAMLVCINATTGENVFTLNGGVYPVAAASGYFIALGQSDGNLYCLGKGPTKTAVMASSKIFAQGLSTLIEGSVIDMSPIAQNYASQVRFANGVPAVADSSMSEWMDYLHMQNATLLNNPPKPEGVPVTLTAVDPNGNTITLGTTTTDYEGNFKLNFAPENIGMYTIRASFDGTESYWSSHAETSLSVIAAPEASATSTSMNFDAINNNTIMSVAAVGIAVIIAIAIAVLLILRKRP